MTVALKLLAAIACSELLIMITFTLMRIDRRLSPFIVDFADTFILSILASVMIFYWVIRPMKTVEEFKKVENELRESELKFKRFFETSKDGIALLDSATGRVLDVNPSLIGLLGYGENEYLGKPLWEAGPFKGVAAGKTAFTELQTKNYLRYEDLPLETLDGREIFVDFISNSYQVDHTKVIQYNLRDTTDRKKALDEVSDRTHQTALGAEIGTVLVQSKDLRNMLQLCTEAIVKHLDAAFARIWTFNEKENILELQASAGMYTRIDGTHSRMEVGKYKIGIIAQEKKSHLTNSVIDDPQVGDPEWAKREGMVAFAGYPLVVADKLVGVMAMFSKKPLKETGLTSLASVSDEIALGIEHKQKESRVYFLAYYDSLTDLPNRNFFKELLKRTIEHASRYKKIFWIALLDLDNFKRINDTLGHEAGDQLLRSVSSRLLKSIRSSDYAARMSEELVEDVARLGGDEFMILLHELMDIKDAGRIIRRIQKDLSEPYDLAGREVFITVSTGISAYPDDGKNVDDLFKNVDTALYHAKNQGKNNYQFYSKAMNIAALEALTMENNLHRALERNELLLYYQPKMDLVSRKVTGMEALVRWKHPESGLISPSQFIPLAEASGLIMPIGKFVLRSACAQNKMWQEAGFRAVSVAVNLSTRQFDQKNLAEGLRKDLDEVGLSAQYLELEITESAIMQNAEAAIRTLHELKAAGIQITLDDFGTGYSSLNYLRRLPLDAMKIDMSFVKNIPTSPSDAVLVKTIIAMAHNLDLKVIAEGVENEQQLAFLLDHGCDEMQGYLFSRPVPAEEFPAFLKA